jgi:hypothetical protein
MAEICVPLTDMLKKNSSFDWSDSAREAFMHLKSLLASKPILTPPDYSCPFVIFVDASLNSVGGVLGQNDDFGMFRPIC